MNPVIAKTGMPKIGLGLATDISKISEQRSPFRSSTLSKLCLTLLAMVSLRQDLHLIMALSSASMLGAQKKKPTGEFSPVGFLFLSKQMAACFSEGNALRQSITHGVGKQ